MNQTPFAQRYWDSRDIKPKLDDLFSLQLSPPLKTHLSRVYFTLTLCLLTSVLFGAVALHYHINSWIYSIINLISIVGFAFTNGASTLGGFPLQPILLGVISSTTGLMLQPICHAANSIDPTIVLSALLLSTVIFASFSFVAMKVERSSLLYLYAPFSALISGFSVLALVGYLFGISLLPYSIMLGISSIILCGYIIFDTHLIIMKFEQYNDTNHYEHALVLFLDFVQLFVRVLRLLMENAKENNKKKRENRD